MLTGYRRFAIPRMLGKIEQTSGWTRWFSSIPNTKMLDQVSMKDLSFVGGKCGSLGEMLQQLTPKGIKIPNGFVVTTEGFKAFMNHNKFYERVHGWLGNLDESNVKQLHEVGEKIRTLVKTGEWPNDLKQEIAEKYQAVCKMYKQDNVDVAVRSSSTAEDLPDASFAGQQDTILNVQGVDQLLDSVRHCFSSLYTDRAISYRKTMGFDHKKVWLSVAVQKMVRSDLGSAGVAFSLDTESGFRDLVLINGVVGLGELCVQGAVAPDEWLVAKKTLGTASKPIIDKKLGRKDKKMVYSNVKGKKVDIVPTTQKEHDNFCLQDQHVMQIAQWVKQIEDHYTQKKGSWCPMDTEWALDGKTGEMFIVQARPETIHSRKDHGTISTYKFTQAVTETPVVKGIAIGDKIGKGDVVVINSISDPAERQKFFNFKKGQILVTHMTDPDWEPIMKKAGAIVTNQGGRTCHSAIVARELGIPAVVGSGDATQHLKDGQNVTVSCAEGEVGKIYNKIIPFEVNKFHLKDVPKVRTPIMLNVGSPENAFHFSHLPNSGVGLAREEFIIASGIGAHPLALMNIEKQSPEIQKQLKELIRGYPSGREYYISKLAQGIARIGTAFYPNPVIVRFSDFKTNEYAGLLGGKAYEPVEENPMIGWRGASRYYDPKFKEAFGLECLAIKRVREEMGLTNVVVMIPFCRTVKECLQVQEVMAEYGLKRGQNGLQLYLMCELPSNVILASEFAKHIDGFSIGSNDLTQLGLGLDRDSADVAHIYDERNPAIKTMISSAIKSAKKAGVKIGICGQGPSDFPDFAQFLVQENIDSISVTPDSVVKTSFSIAELEKSMQK